MSENVGQFTGNGRGIPTRELESLTASVAITASHAIFAERVISESATIGSDINPVYVQSGSITPSTGNVGSWDNPMYLSGGVMTPANRFSNFLPLTGGLITGPLNVSGAVKVSGSLDMRAGDFYLSGAGEYDGTNQSDADTVQEVLRKQGAALTALAAGAKVTLSPSPTVIYKNTTTNVTLTGTLSNVTPSSMKILDGTTVVAETASCARVQGVTSVNISSNTKAFSCEAIYMGVAIVSTATINARNPILYGFAATAADLTKKVSPVTSAVRTYSDVSTANGQHFYIAVPTDITDVSQFAMGGAPFAMNAVTTQTINGISYKVHESAVAYNASTTVTVAASN